MRVQLDFNLMNSLPVRISRMSAFCGITIVVCPILLLIILWLNIYFEARQVRSQYISLDSEYVRLMKELPAIDITRIDKLNRATAVARSLYAGQQQSWTELLYRLEQSVPSGISIKEVSWALNGEGEISGIAEAMEPILELIKRLKEEPYFINPFLASHTGLTQDEQPGIRFRLAFVRQSAASEE